MTGTKAMKRTILAAAAVVAMGFSAGASALPLYWIDDFTSTPPNPFSAELTTQGQSASDGPEGYSIMGNPFTRSVLFENIADTNLNAGGKATLDIAGGELNISNGPNVQSRTTLTYDISSLDALLADDNFFRLNVTYSDGAGGLNGQNPDATSIEAILNGVSLGVWNLTTAIYSGTDGGGFLVSGSQLSGSMDDLVVIINGPAGYDLTVDAIAINVPEPAMIGLFGLGAIGLGLARRRKK